MRRIYSFWIPFAAAAVLALHASFFLCFFVDDEAIPLIFARNLLRGRGLVYTVLEGRTEGYSDFLHVLWSAVVLAVTRLLGFSDLAPLAIGKGVSLVAAIAIVWVTARTMQRAGASTSGLVAGLAFLSLAGPLAIWSCSSLETTMFALLVTALASVLFIDAADLSSTHATAARSVAISAALLLGIAILFERIDGFVYLGALLVAAFLTAGSMRRRSLLLMAGALAVIACAYAIWRYSYFGSFLSTPLEAKVLYRLSGSQNAVVEAAQKGYLRSLLDVYGIPAVVVPPLAIALAWRQRSGRAAAIALIALAAYVNLVGDWMFGWRLIVALLPLMALILALAITRFPPRLSWVAAAGVVVWCAVGSVAFVHRYVAANRWPVFWTRPRADPSVWIEPYGKLLAVSRSLMHPGDRIAYNQAGLLPYALDLENIDDLGICSRFVARLPTTDIEYTAVGRYSPLKNQPVLMTAQAYLLYQDVRYLVSRTHLLRGANRGTVPDELLGGYFRRVAIDASGENAIYERTAKDASAYRRDPARFTENLAHVSRLVRGSIGNDVVNGRDLFKRFGFARGERTTTDFDTATQITLQFASADENVSALYVDSIAVSTPTLMIVRLFNEKGGEVARSQFQLASGARSIQENFVSPVLARTLTIQLQGQPGKNRVTINDLRLEGQSAALRQYLHQNLQFQN